MTMGMSTEISDEFDSEEEPSMNVGVMSDSLEETIPIFGNIKDHMVSPFVEVLDEFDE